MTAIIIGEGESFYRKGTVMKKAQFEKKKKFRRLAAVSLALCMAAVGMAVSYTHLDVYKRQEWE